MTYLSPVALELQVEDSLFHPSWENGPVSLRFSKISKKTHHLMQLVEERDLHQLI